MQKTIAVYDKSGKEVEKVTLNPSIFHVFVSDGLIHEALVRQEASTRLANAVVKGRSDRRGGGKKPWRQKGTGRARTGSIRAAQWRKGGNIFGPSGNENYSKQMPKKQRVKALIGALTAKAEQERLVGLKKYDEKEPKTKNFSALLSALPVERSILLVLPKKNEVLQKSARNIPNVKIIFAQYLNIADILKYEYILFVEDSLKVIDSLWGDMFTPSEKTPEKKKATMKKTSSEAKPEKSEPKTPETKAVAKKSTAKKAPSKKATTKTATKSTTAKKTTVAKSTAKKAAPKKKPVAKKATTKKTTSN